MAGTGSRPLWLLAGKQIGSAVARGESSMVSGGVPTQRFDDCGKLFRTLRPGILFISQAEKHDFSCKLGRPSMDHAKFDRKCPLSLPTDTSRCCIRTKQINVETNDYASFVSVQMRSFHMLSTSNLLNSVRKEGPRPLVVKRGPELTNAVGKNMGGTHRGRRRRHCNLII